MEIMESPASRPLKRARLLPPASDGRRRAAPLLVAAVYDAADLSRVDVRLVDVSSGAVVARLDGLSSGHFAAAGGLVCLVGAGGDSAAVRVLDPATGAATDIITAAPGDATAAAAAAHGHHQRASPPPSHVFGQVPATGEYKVLRIHAAGGQPHHHRQQACEILTLGGSERRWRPAPSPPAPVAAATHRTRAVARGVAHFLPAPPPLFHHHRSHHAAECDAVASFDLGAETWRPALLRGALSSSSGAGGGGGGRVHRAHLSLAELDGCLATVHHNYGGGSIDVWRLADDMEVMGTWTRTHSLRLGSVLCGMGQVVAAGEWESLAQPLAVLGDGRVAVWVEGKGSVRVYDPRTEACVEVADMGRFSCVIGLYTGAMAVNGDKAFSDG